MNWRWVYDWEEAAKRPWLTVVSMSVSGLVAGGLYGYFRFGDSVWWGAVLGLGIALMLGVMGWRIVHNPARVAELHERRLPSRGALMRLALPFAALGIATIVGVAVSSAVVFGVVLAGGLIAGLVVRRFLPR